MIDFPVKRPFCPVCGKRCKIVDSIETFTSYPGGNYRTETVTINCRKDGFFEMMKAIRG